MKERLFYWFRLHLGFSSKETRGFLILIPFLVCLGFLPSGIRKFKDQQGEKTFQRYLHAIDSLEAAGFVLISSPLPGFDPRDTLPQNQRNRVKNTTTISFWEADSVTLQIVPGIGEKLAGRIIKYRDQLGGLHHADQLKEVFGLKEEAYLAIWEYFDFSPQIHSKIPINSIEIQDLSKHPYISYGEAKVIVAFRNQHGRYTNPEDLLKIKIFKPEWVQKISPYLDFD